MTILLPSVLLVGNLSNKFTLNFVNYLLSNGSTNVYLLWHVASGDKISNELVKSNIYLFYGSAKNTGLIQKIIHDNKVT